MIFTLNLVPFRKPNETEQYKKLLSANYPYLKCACVKVVSWHGGGTDDVVTSDAEYLLGRVLEHFMEDGYRRLRNREIRNVKTFLRESTENLFKDILAERYGKDRSKERAREIGDIGLKIYELLRKGHTTDAIHNVLSADPGANHSWENVYRMVQRIRGSNALPPIDGGRVVPVSVDDGDDPDPSAFEVVDSRPNPEEIVVEQRKYELRRQVLDDLDAMLDDEGKAIIRLYYMERGGRRCTVGDIASYLGKTPKAADNKLRRILADFREYMVKKGLRPDDII